MRVKQALPLVRLEETSRQIYCGRFPIEGLTGLEFALLSCFVARPWVRMTKSELIQASWPDGGLDFVTDNSLYQIIRGLRQKLVDDQRRYIVSWRGIPEGGYYFQPAGVPRIEEP